MGLFDLFGGKGKNQQPKEAIEAGPPQAVLPETKGTPTFRARVESLIDQKAKFAQQEIKNLVSGWATTVDRQSLAILDTISTVTEPNQEKKIERDATNPVLVDEAISVFSNILGKDFAPQSQSIKEGWDVLEETPAPRPDPQKRTREEVSVNVFKTQEEGIFWLDISTKYIQRDGREETTERSVIAQLSEATLVNLRGRLKEFDERAATMLSHRPSEAPVAV
jgi:hypothetical protein